MSRRSPQDEAGSAPTSLPNVDDALSYDLQRLLETVLQVRGTMQRIASVSDIPPTGLRFGYREGPFDEEGILLVVAGGEVRAYKNQCRHLPLPLDDRDPGELWDTERRFLVCNSHGARYRPEDGLCVDGPCKGSHLKSLPIEIRDGEVFLDTSKLGSFFDV